MLLFSTTLEINKNLTKYAFVSLVIKWNQTSPYEENIIKGIKWNEEYNIRYGNDKLWLDIQEYRRENIVAVRYEKTDKDGIIWTSDYVANFNEMKMSIRLERSFLDTAINIDKAFSTPYFITMLIKKGFLKEDSFLEISDKPFFADEKHLEIIANVINGKSGYSLPVVYVSKTSLDEYPVDVHGLAERLKGVAHVVVQKSICTNMKLKEMTSNKNETLGSIGIYFPNNTLEQHRRFFYRKASGADTLLSEKVIPIVILYCNSRMTETLYTWHGVNNALLKDRLDKKREERLSIENALRDAEEKNAEILNSLSEKEREITERAYAEVMTEANKMIESFDDEQQRFKKQIEELMLANEKLQNENQRLKNKLDAQDSLPLLFMGDENDFYPGEVKDIILTVLNDALAGLTPDSRRSDIVNDIIRNNNFQKFTDQKANEIKHLLKDYRKMTNAIQKALTDLGFVITDEGKHYKVTYFADGRYHTIFSKTASDWRAGKESAADTIKMAF
ncbi:hypothetical protein J6Y50_09580 [bacterium]|nr:hypothetical protein [bacterium]